MSSEFDSYRSPFSWRYASPEMRQLWSETNKRILWRKVWVALAQAQSEFSLVHTEQVQDLRHHAGQVNITRALEIESEIHHDLMAELKTFAEQSPLGGPILHLGATSMDIEDNADALRLRESLDLVLIRLRVLLLVFADQTERWSQQPIIAFTHLQPAEPSTLGYRLALYTQDLLEDWDTLETVRNHVRGKGFKGAVGTAASYIELIGEENFPHFEKRLEEILDLPFYPVTNQTYPRKQDYLILCALSSLGQTLYRVAFDLRLLQSPPIGELSEPFGEKQVGSSAMPFKRNPIQAEKIDSLARLLSHMPNVAWENAAHSLLERTLDDSANRRSLLPEAFLIVDELLLTMTRLYSKLIVNRIAIQRNLEIYAPFASTERLLMALVRAGADRQEMHERLRQHALAAWSAVQSGQPNPLVTTIAAEPVFHQYLPSDQIETLLHIDQYTGIASSRALEIARNVHTRFKSDTAPVDGPA